MIIRYYVQDKVTNEIQRSELISCPEQHILRILEAQWQRVRVFNVRCLTLIKG